MKLNISLIIIILVLSFVFVQAYWKHITGFECQTDLPPEPIFDFRTNTTGYFGVSNFSLKTICNGGLLSPYTEDYPIK